jgi:ABC-type bacteriocin/lantibiotic exporter with double-glycine peptidase domain
MHMLVEISLKIVLMVTLLITINSFLGILRNKTRILLTHQLQFVSNTDLIIVLKEGKVNFQVEKKISS